MATQSGKLLYETQGYKPIEDILYKTETGKTVPMVRYGKNNLAILHRILPAIIFRSLDSQ